MVCLVSRLNLIKFVSGVYSVSFIAFVIRLSNGAMPVTMRVCEDNMGGAALRFLLHHAGEG
jgi:Na+/H+-dicarboxylate symporter